MKFCINNVCKVNKAEIEADGITVIAGYNDTGKSTILKSIDVFLNVFGNKDANIENERWNSVRRLILKKEVIFDEMGFEGLPNSILYDLYNMLRASNISVNDLKYEEFKCIYLKIISQFNTMELGIEKGEILISDSFIEKIYQGMEEIKNRPIQDYWLYRTRIELNKVFNGASVNLINHKESRIDSGSEKKIQFGSLDVKVSGTGFPTEKIIYLETKNLLDDHSRYIVTRNDFYEYLNKEPEIEVFEQYDKIEQNKKVLNEILEDVLHGRLQRDNDAIKYRDDQIGELINLRNVASGMKTLLIIQRLVENGTLSSGAWLLIDEPETNLHPEWHIKMAEILVLMKKKMNINVIVSSHSAYFIRALEVKLAANQAKEYGKFYLMKPNGNMFDAVDVSDNTEEIYEQLYKPLEEL